MNCITWFSVITLNASKIKKQHHIIIISLKKVKKNIKYLGVLFVKIAIGKHIVKLVTNF